MSNKLTTESLDKAFKLLSGRLDLMQAEPVRLVVCGGSALLAMGLRQRTTRDVDVVALLNAGRELVDPDPLPSDLLEAAAQVARDLDLFEHWLNNGPSRGIGGLFQMGLPDGFASRLTERVYGPRLTVYFISRLDQIHFKLYAAVDQRNEAHMADLQALKPAADELETAARWTMTHDVSEPYRMELKNMLLQMGYESVAKNI